MNIFMVWDSFSKKMRKPMQAVKVHLGRSFWTRLHVFGLSQNLCMLG